MEVSQVAYFEAYRAIQAGYSLGPGLLQVSATMDAKQPLWVELLPSCLSLSLVTQIVMMFVTRKPCPFSSLAYEENLPVYRARGQDLTHRVSVPTHSLMRDSLQLLHRVPGVQLQYYRALFHALCHKQLWMISKPYQPLKSSQIVSSAREGVKQIANE